MLKILSWTYVEKCHVFRYDDGVHLVAVQYHHNNTDWVLVKDGIAFTGPQILLREYMTRSMGQSHFLLVNAAVADMCRSDPTDEDRIVIMAALSELYDECRLHDDRGNEWDAHVLATRPDLNNDPKRNFKGQPWDTTIWGIQIGSQWARPACRRIEALCPRLL
jgi:hypothetical protein